MTGPGASPGAVEAAVRTLFPASVAVAVEAIADVGEALWPAESAAIAGAVPKRLDEFRAGRTAARRALVALGLPAAALPMGRDRAPVWPDGVFGSIAHGAGFAIAVTSLTHIVGVDVEEHASLDPDLWPVICNAAELERLPLARRGLLVRRIFAAKEAVFKAQKPDRRAMFGFDAVEITLAEAAFTARFPAGVGAFRAGQVVVGQFAQIGGLVLAGVAR